MDSSKFTTLGSLKPTIASRRPMLNSQKSLSNLVINTSATHKDFMRKESKHRPSSAQPVTTKAMSPEELSSKIADSFQQFSSMLTQLSTTTNKCIKKQSPITSPLPTSILPATLPKEKIPPNPEMTKKNSDKLALYATSHAIYHESALDDIDVGNTRLRRRLLTTWLTRAAAINDILTLKKIVRAHKDIINESDDLGMTALMYAAYFGNLECMSFLLPCKINAQDKKGWTALIWATLGNQLESVQLLLDHDSDVYIKTKTGKTIFQYPILDTIKQVLGDPPIRVQLPPSPPATLKLPATPIPSWNPIPYDVDFYYQTPIDGYNHYVKPYRRSINDMSQITPPDLSQLMNALQLRSPPKTFSKNESEEEQVQQWAESIKSLTTFVWNQCLPDQMFVFSETDMHFILDQALAVPDTKALINKSQLSMELWQPANIVFLGARFAHYYSTRHLLNSFLSTTVAKLSRIIKGSSRDTHTLAHWIANMCQLSSYLKKDPGLFFSTSDTQSTLSELISGAYGYFISESQKKLEKHLDSCIMDFESFQEQVDFADDWQRFFRRSSYATNQDETRQKVVTDLLSEIQHTLQAYHVPAAIVIQAMAQFFHYLSCEIFNRVLTFKKYLCRSKALQIRMNISVLEDWVRASKLPLSLNQSLEPLVQLLQLLQCLSQLEDVMLFSSTVRTFDKLNPLQVKRCVQNYRYEISETRLPEQVEKMANEWAVEYQKERASVEGNEVKKRPDSICDLDSLLTTNTKRSSTGQFVNKTEQVKSTEEKRNSKYLLPFSITNTTALLHDWTDEQIKAIQTNNNILVYSDTIYKEIKFKKQEQLNVLDKIFPEISQEWLYNLDKKLYA